MKNHINEEHNGKAENVEFVWKIGGKFRKPLQRQLKEAIEINRKSSDVNMNMKHEYNRHDIRRIFMNSNKFQCKNCGKKCSTNDE